MIPKGQHAQAKRLLVVMPTWVGDTVMATPTLRALRGLYPDAYIAAMVRDAVRPVLSTCPWIDRLVTVQRANKVMTDNRRRGRPFRLARRLAAGKFDTAVLLPNSFRTALLARMAGIPRRVGYDRDGRGFLLTDRLLQRRSKGRFVPVPTRDTYLGIARYLGTTDPDPTMRLYTRSKNDAKVSQILTEAGWTGPRPDSLQTLGQASPPSSRPLILINPGANYGDAKMWSADRFAAVADRCVRELGAVVAVTGAPNERPILNRVISHAQEKLLDLPRLGIDLTLLLSVVKMSDLMITNDTGPRHIATAFDVPVVTVFGPTDPAWTENSFAQERQVRVDVFCGPCQKKRCPLDHRCMTLVEPAMVFDRAAELLQDRRTGREAVDSPDQGRGAVISLTVDSTSNR